MSIRFIFMLTHNDRTIDDAAARLADVQAAGVTNVGFKDVGLPFDELKELNRRIKTGGGTSYLEVVSLDTASELASARAALEIGVDMLLGGTRPRDVLPEIRGSGIRYYPFAGHITGHPSVLNGTADEIRASAVEIAALDGVDGVDLLAYRAPLDVPAMIRTVCDAVGKPVIVAGSIDSAERIATVARAGAAGFTVGTAAFAGSFKTPEPGLDGQLRAIAAAAASV